MRHRIHKRCTVLISSTGSSPVTLSVNPKLLFGVVALAIAIPTLWIAGTFNAFIQQNRALSQRNEALTEEAANILEELETLEAKIEHLQERAGVDDGELSELSDTPPALPRGGPGRAATPEELLEQVQVRLPLLSRDLQNQVEPALEETLEREAARPQGIPLKGRYELSSSFGLRRNPFGGGYEFHEGLDFTGAYGSPIYATASGVVETAEFSGGYGYHVIVNHGYGYRTLYAHLSKIEVTPGMQINRDRIVGYLGNTGRSSGPHLHYEVEQAGQPVDPSHYLLN
jgi:murein DD-endopeptidase MepM/ murein hydrolase activator NlpD